ncbi:MAG: cytochrome c-type biogenesis protein CcmH [Acidobacteriota bacterium]
MNLKLYTIYLLIITSFFAPLYSITVNEIAKELICPCGCNKMLNVCEMASAKEMKDIISQMITQGKSKNEVIKYFVGIYGERILSTPTKRGFNLTAWITPFLIIALGGIIIYLTIVIWVLRWRERARIQKKEIKEEEVESLYGEKLKKELREFDR